MKWWGWVIVALIVLWAIHNPTSASNDVHNVGTFVNNLTH